MDILELKKRLTEKKQILFEMRMKHNLQRQSNPLQIRFLKKDISRLETVLSSRPPEEFAVLKKQKPIDKKPEIKKSTVKKAAAKKKNVSPPAEKPKEPTAKKAEPKKAPAKRSWFGFGPLKTGLSKNTKSAAKKSFFRRKSG